GTEIITAISNDLIAVYNRSDRKSSSKFKCSSPNSSFHTDEYIKKNNYEFLDADDSVLKTFKVAISTTGEYTQYHGGTKVGAISAINSSLTRINGLYETDFNITMTLVNNTNIIYTNPNTDPYAPGGFNNQLSTVLDSQFPGGAGYDVGHLYSLDNDNGNAGCIGCICRITTGFNAVHKGSAFTSSTIPEGDRFDIDYVAHEFGHQYGANHTHTHNANEGSNVQMEPGSGTTVMGYAGITGANTDVAQVSHDNFHSANIEQVINYIDTQSCQSEFNTGNTTPFVSAGNNVTLPISTPFRLTGSSTDADGDFLTYTWEQFDENDVATTFPDPNSTSSDSILFRCYKTDTSPTRIFPALENLLENDVNGYKWEKIPNVSRNADFRFTVRDNKVNGGNNSHDDMRVTWNISRGPFDVTSQSATNLMWSQGDTELIEWDVNNTNTMNGAANVDIFLSIDGGLTYPITLASNTPNDGSHSIIVPNNPAPFCRIMVQPSNQVLAPFFDINTIDFAIDYIVTSTTTCSGSIGSGPLNLSIPDGVGPNANGTPVSNTINVTGQTGNVLAANGGLKINIVATHSYIQDLYFLLIAPNGTSAVIWERECGSAQFQDFDITFEDNASAIVCASPTNGIFAPSNDLSVFDGQPKNGNWRLLVADFYNGDVGEFENWSIEFCETVVTVDPVAVLASENQIDDSSDFTVYPNPSNGLVTVNLSSSEDVKMSLYDIRGRNVYTEMHRNNALKFNKQVDFSSLAAGVYILNVESGSNKVTKKIVIQ
ncbi:M12 family metallo-peptidase, partial [Flavobacteriaceae bacterium]|nr:M12 family metallo-peptidase [Flavobacteriaceae bacterium]